MTKKSSPKADAVWAYLAEHQTATPAEVAKATGVSYGYAYKLMQNIANVWENGVVGSTMREERKKEEAKSTAKKPQASGGALKASSGERLNLLNEAIELTGGDRNADYGDPYDNHKLIADIAALITGKELTAYDIVMVQVATKLSRMKVSRTKRDHYVDLMAYAGIAYECLREEDIG